MAGQSPTTVSPKGTTPLLFTSHSGRFFPSTIAAIQETKWYEFITWSTFNLICHFSVIKLEKYWDLTYSMNFLLCDRMQLVKIHKNALDNLGLICLGLNDLKLVSNNYLIKTKINIKLYFWISTFPIDILNPQILLCNL
jgi:hypothetical protein